MHRGYRSKKKENKKSDKHSDEDPIYFNHYDPEALHDILDTQHKITLDTKKKNFKRLFQILMIIDDFADSPKFTRQSKMLHSLYVRGRHTHDQHEHTYAEVQRYTSHFST